MPAKKDRLSENTSDRGIVTIRTINANRELLWKAWTDPKHLAEWWGPNGFTNTFNEFDFRPGGTWRFTMHGPNGKDFHNESVFVEIVKLERIVFEHLKPMHKFQVITTFEEQSGQTRVTFRMLFESAAECETVKKYAVEANEENFDRLERELEIMSEKKEFVISREFDAPLERVWKVWTDCEHLKHWWGPKGFTVRVCKLDLRPGGLLHYCLQAPDGSDMWGKFVYREIVKQAKLVFVNSFSDEKAGTTRHFAHDSWPLEMLSTILFSKQGNKTKITVKWVTLNATELENKTFYDNFEGMRQGWGGTFEQLAEYLEKT